MGLFTEQYNDWGDRRTKWQNIILFLVCIAVVYLLIR